MACVILHEKFKDTFSINLQSAVSNKHENVFKFIIINVATFSYGNSFTRYEHTVHSTKDMRIRLEI